MPYDLDSEKFCEMIMLGVLNGPVRLASVYGLIHK